MKLHREGKIYSGRINQIVQIETKKMRKDGDTYMLQRFSNEIAYDTYAN